MMIFCRYPISLDDIIMFSANTKTIPYNIDELAREMKIEVHYKDELRYIDTVCEVMFETCENKHSIAKIIIKSKLPNCIHRFLLARALYYAIYDPDKKRHNMLNTSYTFLTIELTNPYYFKNDIDANAFALDLLIPDRELEKCNEVINGNISSKTIKKLAEYFDVTIEMIITQLYYKGWYNYEQSNQ